MFNQKQAMGQLQQLLQALGAVATMFGYATDKVSFWTALILQIAGPIMMLVGFFWSGASNTQNSQIASVDAIAKDPKSPIQGIVTTNTPEGRELAASLPGLTTAPAGTPIALTIARANGAHPL